MSFVLGITGGIASGKSTVVDVFKRHDFPIVDGDVIARQAVEPGTAGLQAVVQAFGTDILLSNGALDRKKLGARIFADPKERYKLDHTLGKFIRNEILDQIQQEKQKHALVVADIPLLYETKYEEKVDAVAVVYVTADVQLARLMKRNGYTKEEALQRINSQLPLEEKRARADVVFNNNGLPEETKQQVENWLQVQGFVR